MLLNKIPGGEQCSSKTTASFQVRGHKPVLSEAFINISALESATNCFSKHFHECGGKGMA